MNIPELYARYKESYLVCTDTRKILPNSIFFALKGANFNGNAYAEEALEKGAQYAVVDEEDYQTDERIFLVDDVLKSLQGLARYHREQLGIPILSLTGSNGKTTTKELINAVLSQKFNTVATQGNLNNHIGVPLTLLSMTPATEFGIVEMGANHQREIAILCSIALPDYGYITNFGKAHLEGFGGIEGVIKGKSELYDHLGSLKKHVFVNNQDPLQLEKSEGIAQTRFGDQQADVSIAFDSANPNVKLVYKGVTIHSQLMGVYNFNNLAAAVAIGDYFKIAPQKIKHAIESYIPTNNRSQRIEKGSNIIILDAYNANPSSMQVALENLEQMPAEHKMAILGDMFELGETADQEHQSIADLAAELKIREIHLVGAYFAKVNASRAVVHPSFGDLKDYLSKQQPKGYTILIKASRGMALERLLELF